MDHISNIDYPDASHTYRGYRRQALYVLHRILAANPDVRFQPEYREDLAVYDTEGKLQELVQVKDYSQPLQLSDFNPSGKSAFFIRCADAICTHHDIKLTLASFGEIGPELKSAIEQNGKERASVAKRIAKCGYVNQEVAQEVLARLQVEECSETTLETKINTALGHMVTAINPREAFGGLSSWVFRCSEDKQCISREDLSKKVLDIGQFMADLTSYQAEWLSTIKPIENTAVHPDRIAQLKGEFHSGVAARYEHIEADLDVVRPVWLQAMDEKLSSCNVIFLHAPSGQGKSTLAYRYLKESCPSIARFEVKHVENASHALRVARALGAHIHPLGLPVTVYVDIPPQHDGWLLLIKELSFYRNIRVVATIREEDWRRANVSGAEFRWHDVELEFTEQEAREVFGHLTRNSRVSQFASFEEAWERFGGKGPLLEFVHLITQGGLLRERLKQQIEGLQNQVRQGQRNGQELDLLRVVSVASTFAARLNAHPLLKDLGFTSSGNPLSLLEKEYLVRISEDGLFIEGLHPIRSRIVADLLCDPLAAMWGETARECLPYLDDQRLEIFLLSAFSESMDFEEPVLEGLHNSKIARWRQLASITRALLWLGVSRYVRTNLDLIRHVDRDLGFAWWIALDFDIGSVLQRENSLFRNAFLEKAWTQIQEIRQRQSARSEVFMPLTDWLRTRTIPEEDPSSSEDWNGLAEVMYWNAREGEVLPILKWFPWEKAAETIETLPIDTLANLVLALHESYGENRDFTGWFSQYRASLLDQFRKQTLTIKVEDDGADKIEAHFIVRFDLIPDPQSADYVAVIESNPLHAEASYRLDLLRKLAPDRKQFACKGFGHLVLDVPLPIDETHETGVPKENLPIEWAVKLNSTFLCLGDFALRLSSWREYANEIIQMRKCVVKSLDDLVQVLETYFRKTDCFQVMGNLLDFKTWQARTKVIESTSRFPQCVVDRFGFTSETKKSTGTKGSKDRLEGFSLGRYRSWKQSSDGYRRAVSTFMRQSVDALSVLPAVGRGQAKNQKKNEIIEMARRLGLNDGSARLSLLNLSDAYGALPVFQDEYRRVLPASVLAEDLVTLESQEHEAFANLWPIWYNLVDIPEMVIKDPVRICRRREDRIRTHFVSACEKEFSRQLLTTDCSAQIIARGARLEGEPTVWIRANSEKAVASHLCIEVVLTALRSAYSKQTNQKRLGYLLDREWARIAVIPCVKGRPLIPAMWTLRPNTIQDASESSFWNEVLKPVPAAILDAVGLKCWEHPRLATGYSFFRSFVEFVFSTLHIRELHKIGETDEQGLEIAQGYFRELESERLHYYQRAIDTAKLMKATFDELPEIEQEQRHNLLRSAANVQKWIELAKPPNESDDGQISMTVSEMAKWSSRLQEANEFAYAAYVFWADDVLEQDVKG